MPNVVDSKLINGAYVLDAGAQVSLIDTGFTAAVTIDRDFFFR